jgi:HEAT repeat protein
LKNEDAMIVYERQIDVLTEKGSKPLLELLKDQNAADRWRATYFLGKIKSEEAVEPLLELLKDADVSDRVVDSLGEIATGIDSHKQGQLIIKLNDLANNKDEYCSNYIKAIEQIKTSTSRRFISFFKRENIYVK